MPPMPDNVTWAYDPKRDQGVLMPAYYGAGSRGVLPPTREPSPGWARPPCSLKNVTAKITGRRRRW